jgi:beta-N-acetylhexosaminidase
MERNLEHRFISILLLALIALPYQARSPVRAQGRALPPQIAPYPSHPSAAALRWADEQLRRMSFDEKIGQLIHIGVNATFLNQESEAFRALRRQVEENQIGGIILFRGPVYESVHLMNRMQSLARIPLLISADLEAGSGMRFEDATDFPWNMAVAATGDPDYARRQGEITAREARALGVQMIFAPVADVNNNAANPVINVRSYGEDPATVARFVAAFIEGAQRGGVIATAKHFPGHGDTAIDSHRGLPVINVGRQRLDEVELVPFRAAIRTGVGAIMTGHIGLPQLDPTAITPLPRERVLRPVYAEEGSEIVVEKATLPATLSPVITGRLLRGELGFRGLVVTDALDMSGLTLYFTQDEAAVRAIEAGADMLLKPADPDACIRGLREAVRTGRLSEKRIEESVRRILAAKYDLGLVQNRYAPLEAIDRLVASREAEQLAQEIAARAITLVRDEAKLLPLRDVRSARIFNLAVTNGEDRLWVARPFTTELGHLGARVETAALDDRSSEEEWRKALERAARADLIVVSLYGRIRSGQPNSASIPQAGASALRALLDGDRPVIGISFGNPYLLQNFPNLKTYLVAYGDMPCLQQAAARALLGVSDITGHLPISLPGLYARGTGIQLRKGEAGNAASR